MEEKEELLKKLQEFLDGNLIDNIVRYHNLMVLLEDIKYFIRKGE